MCPFGVRSSGNIWAELLAPIIAKYRGRGIRAIVWVDDVMLLTLNRCGEQDACAGAGECPACTECRDKALALEIKFELCWSWDSKQMTRT